MATEEVPGPLSVLELKNHILQLMRDEPDLIGAYHCVREESKDNRIQEKKLLAPYIAINLSTGNHSTSTGTFQRKRDIITLGFRGYLSQSDTTNLLWDIAEMGIHAIKYVPNFPHHVGAQQLRQFLQDMMGKMMPHHQQFLEDAMGKMPPHQQRAKVKLDRSDLSRKLALKRMCLDLMPKHQRRKGPHTHQEGTPPPLCDVRHAAWLSPTASAEDALGAVVSSTVLDLPIQNMLVICNQLDQWRLALPRLQEGGFDQFLTPEMLKMMKIDFCAREINPVVEVRQEVCVIQGDLMLSMQTYTAPLERKASVARYVVCVQCHPSRRSASTDTRQQCRLVLAEGADAEVLVYQRDGIVLQPPSFSCSSDTTVRQRYMKLTDTRIAASFMHLIKHTMELPRLAAHIMHACPPHTPPVCLSLSLSYDRRMQGAEQVLFTRRRRQEGLRHQVHRPI